MSAPGRAGERQEHLDAIISFAGTGQRRRLFRVLDILTVKWATGRPSRGMPIPAVLEEGKGPHHEDI